MSPLERLREVARSRKFPDDDATLARLLAYLEAVLEEGLRVNLTAARTLDGAVEVLALSALSVTRAWESEQAPRIVVDLGTGNGLPGIAAALAWPTAEVILLERRAKKARGVSACVSRVGLANTATLTCDGREVLRERPALAGAVDLVTVRAVGTLAEAVRMAAPWLSPGGRIAHWKGAALAPEERKAGARAARAAGLSVLPDLAFPDEAGPAHLLLYERPAGNGARLGPSA